MNLEIAFSFIVAAVLTTRAFRGASASLQSLQSHQSHQSLQSVAIPGSVRAISPDGCGRPHLFPSLWDVSSGWLTGRGRRRVASGRRVMDEERGSGPGTCAMPYRGPVR
jgi:hypothetical protein